MAHVKVTAIMKNNQTCFSSNLGDLLTGYEKVIIPEMNQGQLSMVIRDKYLREVTSLPKMQGLPFTVNEIKQAVIKEISHVY